MFFGCATNCLPFALPARFAFVVAAYSCGLNASIAFFGKYRSPVTDDFLPDLVVHFWSPQFFKDCCGAFNLLLLLFQEVPYQSVRQLYIHLVRNRKDRYHV